jgi:hypothetical protein
MNQSSGYVPGAAADVSSGQWVTWESGVFGSFPDGNYFYSYVAHHDDSGGYGVNKYHSFQCTQDDTYRYLYSGASGWCWSVYYCQKQEPMVKVLVQPSDQKVTLYGTNQSAADIIGKIDDAGPLCNASFPIDGTPCGIQFTCDGGALARSGNAQTLKYLAASSSFSSSHVGTGKCVTYYSPAPNVEECIVYDYSWVSFPRSVAVDAIEPAPGPGGPIENNLGDMRYDISCPASSSGACGAILADVTIGGAIPAIGGFFNIPKAFIQAVCQ